MFKLQMDYNGRFRILHKSGATSEWTHYRSLATLEHDGKTYVAGSEYGLLPKAETVYEVTALPTSNDASFEWTDRFGADHSHERDTNDPLPNNSTTKTPGVNPSQS